MEKEVLFAIISTLILIVGYTPLWRDIIRGRTIPHPFTVLVWCILVSINIYILFKNGEYIGMLAPGVLWLCLFGEVIVGFTKIKKISINWFDYLCLALSVSCLIYLIIYKNLYHTAILTILVDFIALLPIFKKSWLQPWTETAWSYFIGGVGQLFTILALKAPNSETYIFWLYILIMDAIVVVFILYRRYYLKGWKSIFE